MKSDVIYESFNAKNIPFHKISKSFIPNEEFFQIAKDNHTLVMGPRGCGKTTMFKMLTSKALFNWDTKNSNELTLKKKIPFIAIYIPADEIWKEQFDEMENRLSQNPNSWNKIKNSIFCTNIFVSLIEAIKDHLSLNYKNDTKINTQISITIIRAFLLRKDLIPTLDNVINELNFRFQEIYLKYEGICDGLEEEFEQYYRLDFLKALMPICTHYETLTKSKTTRWALCFDECELIPKELFFSLLNRLRAIPEKFLFKLSTAPTLPFSINNTDQLSSSAKKDHDYDSVTMWPDTHEKNKRYKTFCTRLAIQRITSILIRKYDYTGDVNLADFFGNTRTINVIGNLKSLHPDNSGKRFVDLINADADEYAKNSIEYFAFKEYAFLDEHFKKKLIKKGVNPDNPVSNVKQRDELLRKVYEIVVCRLTFFKYSKKDNVINKSVQGGNFRPNYYHGVDTLVTLVDGNPRYLIGLIDEFRSYIKVEGINLKPKKITKNQQHKIFNEASLKLLAKIESVPLVRIPETTNKPKIETSYHLYNIVTKIGAYFYEQINTGQFKSDPNSCFYIDSKSINDRRLLNQIRIGVYLGVFISLPSSYSELSTDEVDLKGERFRLTHLLAPKFSLPKRQFKKIALSTIINPKKIKAIPNQKKLNI